MSVGLIALLDDVAAIAKAAAASVDDVAAQAGRAGMKSAGIVIDDAAVAPGYVTGLPADRELPIIWRIAVGSMRNKLLFLLPAALALSWAAPWAITPLLMLGGAYLCYEGAEKVWEAVAPHAARAHEARIGAAAPDAAALEEVRVASAVRTDFILSAEIMALTLSTVAGAGFFTQAAVLGVVGALITVAVYGAVAGLVRLDDLGLAMTRNGGDGAWGRLSRRLGRAMVTSAVPLLMTGLTVVGAAAMLWVGGGILSHGLGVYGLHGIEDLIHDASHSAAATVSLASGVVGWIVGAVLAGVFGLALGLALIPLIERAAAPLWRRLRGLVG